MRERLLASQDWVDGRQTVGSQGAQVKRNEQLDENSPLRTQLGERIRTRLQNQPLFLPPRCRCVLFCRALTAIKAVALYGMHIDGAVMRLDGQTQLRSDLSCTLF